MEPQTKQEVQLKKVHLYGGDSSNFCIVSIVVVPKDFKKKKEKGILSIIALF
jgi:hypothetical protein